MAEIHELWAEGPLKIGLSAGSSDTLVVSFSGVGRKQLAEPPIEFHNTAKGGADNSVLFVRDLSRSWLNAPGMAERIAGVIEATVRQLGVTRVVAVGNSMGATMALHLSRLTRFDVVLAFTPQFSVDPAIVPEETNWREYRAAIADYRFPSVEGLRGTGTQYFILHGGKPSELIHALRFPRHKRVAHFILPDMGHKLTFGLKERGVMGALVTHALAGRNIRVRKLLERQGAMFRSVFEARFAERVAALSLDQATAEPIAA